MKLDREWLSITLVVFLPKFLGLLISIYIYKAYSAEDIGVFASNFLFNVRAEVLMW
jgi:hypothetical protein